MDLVAAARKKVVRQQNWVLGISAVCTFAAFAGVLSLQSSINIESELGTTCLAVTYSVTAIWNLLFTSSILKTVGAKKALLMSDVFYMVYTLANIYPTWATLMPAAVLIGIAQSLAWTAFPHFSSHFGKQYAWIVQTQCDEKRDAQFVQKQREGETKPFVGIYVNRFVGMFYAILSGYLIFGNMASYAILRYGESGNLNQSDLYTNYSDVKCGASQCSASSGKEVDGDNADLDKYKIQNWRTRLCLFLGFSAIQAIAMAMHVFLLRDPRTYEWNTSYSENALCLDGEIKSDLNIEKEAKTTESFTKTDSKNASSFASDVFSVLRHLATVQGAAMIPLPMYSGMVMAFIFGDFTRAYISCTFGVLQIGLVMSVLGATEILTCIAFTRLVAITGRNVVMAIMFLSEAGVLLFLLMCEVGSSQTWLPFLMAILLGIPDGLRQSLITATYVGYFGSDGGPAYSSIPLLCGIGSSIIYSTSRSLCVYQKIYFLFAFMVPACFGYILAERRFGNIRKT